MLHEYIYSQLNKASYELIDEGKRYYGEIEGLRGVWATGKTLEECRHNLLDVLEGWIVLRLKKNISIPGFSASRSKKQDTQILQFPVYA